MPFTNGGRKPAVFVWIVAFRVQYQNTSLIDSVIRRAIIDVVAILTCSYLRLVSAPCFAQWVLTYEKEDVIVDGATYRVNWQAKDGGVDFRTHRNEFHYSSSPLDEKRRNMKAAVLQAAWSEAGAR